MPSADTTTDTSDAGRAAAAIEPLLVDAKTARVLLGGISARLLWSMSNSGEIPSVKLRTRRMYDPADLRAWRDALKEGGGR